MGRKRGLSDEQVQRVQHLYHNTKNKVSQIAKLLNVSPGPIHNIIERTGAYKDIPPFVRESEKQSIPRHAKKKTKMKTINKHLPEAKQIINRLSKEKLERAVRYLRCLEGPK